MKAKILDKTGKEKGTIDMPVNFSQVIRRDILQKVFESLKEKQPMGSMIGAGAGYSASGILRHRRHVWKTTYGKGISRVPRKIMSRHGDSFNWVGATVSSARGGRKAHPPKAEENQYRKINKKEMKIAMDSAFAGTIDEKSIEVKYGNKVSHLPLVFDSSVLQLKTKEMLELLRRLFGENYEKIIKIKSIRSGKGKLRGRKYKSNTGLLFVLGSDEKMNRKGISVVNVKELELSDLSPNGTPGRFAAYTEKAIKEIGERWK